MSHTFMIILSLMRETDREKGREKERENNKRKRKADELRKVGEGE